MKKAVLLAALASAASVLIAFAQAGRPAPPAETVASAPSRPNVVLLLVEGAGPRLLDRSSSPRVSTPNLDRIVARGRRFDAAYSQYPAAGASRTSLLTGWRPEKTGVWGEPEGRVDGATPIEEHFHAQGYFTARAGPVFHGPGEAEFRWDAVDPPRAARAGVALRAAAVVAEAREPFFLAASLGRAPSRLRTAAGGADGASTLPAIAAGPLGPMARPGGTARPRRLADSERAALMAAEDARVSALDGQVGAILDALDRRGASDRTLVVLAGDAAAPSGEHGALARGDLLFDETLRVPLVIAGPGVSAPGTAAAALVELVDVYPTLVQACGLPPVTGLDGKSLVPLLADAAAEGRAAVFSAVGREAGQLGRSLRTARYRYSEWPDGSEELYDHDKDPHEFVNLARAAGHEAALAEMRRRLDAREKAKKAPATSPPAAAPARPLNVLLILIDDLNAHVGSYGYPVSTPNIDRLAARGRRFDHAYAQVAMCSPSRSSLLSGWRPERTDIWTNLTPVRQHLDGARPLQELFHGRGYFTGRVGKIYEGAMADQFAWDFDDEAAAPGDDGRRDDDAVKGSWWAATANDDAHEPDGARARRLAQILEQRKGAPFFLAAGFSKPHVKWVAPRRYFDMYPPERVAAAAEPADDLQDIPAIAIKNRAQERPGVALAGREPPGMVDDPGFRREAISAYHACVSFVDAQVGVLMDALDRLKLWDSTIVVLLGDHGYHLGEHHGLWRKDTLFEEALRTPLVIAAPQVVRPGVAAAAEVELLDLYPTLVELAGLPPPPGLDGVSLVPLLRDPAARAHDGALSFRKAKAPPLGVSVRTARYRYTQWPDGSEELYDHASDAGEQRNVAADPAAAGALDQMRALSAAGPSAPAAAEEKSR
jgi:iduronate 2-sulfatase